MSIHKPFLLVTHEKNHRALFTPSVSLYLYLATASPAEQVGIAFLERAERCVSPFCILQQPP